MNKNSNIFNKKKIQKIYAKIHCKMFQFKKKLLIRKVLIIRLKERIKFNSKEFLLN